MSFALYNFDDIIFDSIDNSIVIIDMTAVITGKIAIFRCNFENKSEQSERALGIVAPAKQFRSESGGMSRVRRRSADSPPARVCKVKLRRTPIKKY